MQASSQDPTPTTRSRARVGDTTHACDPLTSVDGTEIGCQTDRTHFQEDAMANPRPQGLFARGVYEFEDPSGTLIAAQVPFTGSADLYDGTAVIVRPNQVALLVYKGEVTDLLGPGTHYIKTGNV